MNVSKMSGLPVYTKVMRIVFASAGFLLVMMSPGFAAAEGLQLKTEAFAEVEVVDKAGKITKQIKPLTNALPGQEVIYEITYTNTGTKPAEKVVVNNAIPASLVFQPGSAIGENAVFEVSVDGGKQFGALETLKVNNLPATANDVTHVRWVIQSALKPGGEGKVSYRTLLK